MAGDWIKMRGNLWDDPRIAKLCDLTGAGEAQIIGGLYWLWATADQHTEDGCMPGLTLRQIDRKTGVKGLGEALVAIGWLADDPQGVVIVKFTEHNGTSAKRRCTEAQRKANVRNLSASDADTSGTTSSKTSDAERQKAGREADENRRTAELEKEKRREEKKRAGKPAVSARGSRLPPDWDPGPEGMAFASEHGLANGMAQEEVAKFRDYWASAVGSSASKADWSATWRNWVRKASEFGHRNGHNAADGSTGREGFL